MIVFLTFITIYKFKNFYDNAKAKINVQANLLEISYTKREDSEFLSAGDKLIAEEKYYQEFHELPPRSI